MFCKERSKKSDEWEDLIKALKEEEINTCAIEKWIEKGRNYCMINDLSEHFEIEGKLKGTMRGFFDSVMEKQAVQLPKAKQAKAQSKLMLVIENRVKLCD